MSIQIHPHAQKRIRQRFGLNTLQSMVSWARAKKIDGKLNHVQGDGRRVYRWGDVELVFSPNEKTLLTVKDLAINKRYEELLGSTVVKEARKLLVGKERAFRKAEINEAQIRLNMLKTRNPKYKAKLNDMLTKATDEKDKLLDEITVIKNTVKKYGVEV